MSLRESDKQIVSLDGYHEPQRFMASTFMVIGAAADINWFALKPDGNSDKICEILSWEILYNVSNVNAQNRNSLFVASAIGDGVTKHTAKSEYAENIDRRAQNPSWNLWSSNADETLASTGIVATREVTVSKHFTPRLLTAAGWEPPAIVQMVKGGSFCIAQDKGIVLGGVLTANDQILCNVTWREWRKKPQGRA